MPPSLTSLTTFPNTFHQGRIREGASFVKCRRTYNTTRPHLDCPDKALYIYIYNIFLHYSGDSWNQPPMVSCLMRWTTHHLIPSSQPQTFYSYNSRNISNKLVFATLCLSNFFAKIELAEELFTFDLYLLPKNLSQA